MAETIADVLGVDDIMTAEETTPTRPIRLSVSALRDYRTCPRYYKLKRIDKISGGPDAHYLAAGNVVHESFYAAFNEWSVLVDMPVPSAITGTPNVTAFEKRAELMFEFLWERNNSSATVQEGSRQNAIDAGIEAEYLDWVAERTPIVENFTFGALKALKDTNYGARAKAWKEHYRQMLLRSVEVFLNVMMEQQATIVTTEERVDFQLGSVDMLGFIDITLKLGNGDKVLVDLKTGMHKPPAGTLDFEDQMQTYFAATDADEVWLFHMRSGEIFRILRNKKLINSLSEMAEQDAMSIEAGFFPKRFDRAVCARCDYRKVCHGT